MGCAFGAGFSRVAAAKAGASAGDAPIVLGSGEDTAALIGVGAGGGGGCETTFDTAESVVPAGPRTAVPSAETGRPAESPWASAARTGASAWGAPIVLGSGETNPALTGAGAGGGGACTTADETADFGNGEEIAGERAGARKATVVLAGCAGSRAGAARFTETVTGWRDV